MNKGLNKVMLIGWLDKKPEMRMSPSGRAVTVFTLNIPYTWSSPEGKSHQETELFQIISWDGLAELSGKQFAPGDWIYIEGRLQTRHWHDAENKIVSRTEIVAQNLMRLDLALPD